FRRELIAYRHQAGHFGLGDRDLLSAPGGEIEIGNLEVGEVLDVGGSVHASLLIGERLRRRGKERRIALVIPRESRINERSCDKPDPEPGRPRAFESTGGLLQRSSGGLFYRNISLLWNPSPRVLPLVLAIPAALPPCRRARPHTWLQLR